MTAGCAAEDYGARSCAAPNGSRASPDDSQAARSTGSAQARPYAAIGADRAKANASGADDPIAEANRSRARYRRAESVTGRAWSSPGKLILANFPSFSSRHEFEDFYVNRIEIDQDVVSDLSSYMERVRALLAYGLEDANRRFLGVVSIDFSSPIGTLRTEDGTQITLSEVDPEVSPGEPGVELDQLRVRDAFQAMESVLGAFHQSGQSA